MFLNPVNPVKGFYLYLFGDFLSHVALPVSLRSLPKIKLSCHSQQLLRFCFCYQHLGNEEFSIKYQTCTRKVITQIQTGLQPRPKSSPERFDQTFGHEEHHSRVIRSVAFTDPNLFPFSRFFPELPVILFSAVLLNL